ncbi:PREDICTED: steryl-sulfatase-like [Amphimedon queenslandica]|uniref:Sulfatase N-terminal domain-containing protein n=1 Tax=Amphimedon queenslandica TaxID=400682 RepID=A0A1X7VJZ2_AMPQE|nr:PREDICTED: steryl-sulfatase-like [Amphimedon queenslandica]|eukprot:XP_011409959.1 PREDICTED: steryl-sulfatase-like [Amphimedon queenslandica]
MQVLSGFVLLLLVALVVGETRPNILFILADDLGYGDVGVYPNPNDPQKRLITPNLNSLAGESMRFTDAYAGAPVCAPSRCTLMTGRHTGHCTVRANGGTLNSTDVTVAQILQKAGYYTALVGKWGLGSTDTVGSPNNKGFHHFYGYTSQENAHNYYPPFLWRNDKQVMFPENQNASDAKCGSPRTEHCTWAEDAFINETLNLLSDMANQTKPFYLFLSFTTPHAGAVGSDAETGVPGPSILPAYQSLNWPEVEKYFASVVEMQDKHVGEVLQALDSLKLKENTVVFFASDNGAHNEGGHSYKFFESSGPLRGYKRSLHEGGVRSPLIIRWPGVTEPNKISNQQWGFWDFLQTAADIANVDPSLLPTNLDGYSLVPTLQGKQQDQPKYNYHEYCHPNEDHKGYGQAVRFDNWKAVRYDEKEAVELYDLSNDLGEETDVSSKYPSIVKKAVSYIEEAHIHGDDCIIGEGPDTFPMMSLIEAKSTNKYL